MTVKTYFSVGGLSKEMKKGSKVSVDGYARKLHKLYASVNGQSKLIFDDGDPQPEQTIVYYQDDPAMPYKTMTTDVTTLSLSTFWNNGVPYIQQLPYDGPEGGYFGRLPSRWIRGVRIGTCVQKLTSFLTNLKVSDNVPGIQMPVYIPDTVGNGEGYSVSTAGFMFSSTSFNQPIFLGSTFTSIGNGFMRECTNFNQPFVLPPKTTWIGSTFMLDCHKFNQDITIPQTVTSIGDNVSGSVYAGGFLRDCWNYTSTVDFGNLLPGIFDQNVRWDCFATTKQDAPMYTEGIKVKVAPENLNYWRTAFGDLNGERNLYRKIIWLTD